MRNRPLYRRIVLKLSGEALACKTPDAIISREACQDIARGIRTLCSQGVQVAVVVGGGNIFRGIQAEDLGIGRVPADQMGMLSTLINGLALQSALEKQGYKVRVLSAIDCPRVVESFDYRFIEEYFYHNEILIFVGGTGNPFFTTDSAAALRASEIGANAVFKATKVDGVYNKDPLKYPDAVKYKTLTYTQFYEEKLGVMDTTAIALCERNEIPVVVFNMKLLCQVKPIDLTSIQKKGTLITEVPKENTP